MSASAKRQGMAIASLILGIVSVTCFGLFAGLPAIILGHAAHRKARKMPSEYSGEGLAVAGFVMGYLSILTTLFLAGVLAGLLLPALHKARQKAQSIKCANNLQQIGVAFRVWATDHGEFPFRASTNENNAAEPGDIQIDPTSPVEVRVFQALANEIGSPHILICPGDRSKQWAPNFQSLQSFNISYEIETGPEVSESNPAEVLARCPVHGHELFCDGSVHRAQ